MFKGVYFVVEGCTWKLQLHGIRHSIFLIVLNTLKKYVNRKNNPDIACTSTEIKFLAIFFHSNSLLQITLLMNHSEMAVLP